MRPVKDSIVVLDIDGTLTDSVVLHQAALATALRSFGFPNLRTDWTAYRHHSDSAIFAEAWEEAGFAGPADTAQFEAQFQAAFDDVVGIRPIKPIPGSSEFLAALEASRWIACYATGSLKYGAMRKLEILSAPIDDELLVTASDHQTREDIVQSAIGRARGKYRISHVVRTISVGDGLWDLLTAQMLGVEFLAVAAAERAESFRSRRVRTVPNLLRGISLLD